MIISSSKSLFNSLL